MRYFIGCLIAAAAGAGLIQVPDPIYYDFPELFLSAYV